MIKLFTSPTPNGHKVSCLLEALELEYEVEHINLAKGEQKTPDYLQINPNGRIPAIIDQECNDLTIFESGAIMIYLAEKTGKLLPSKLDAKAKVLQWLMFQMGGVGPMMGQANVFYRYYPEKLQGVIDRYQNESRRLLKVLDGRLSKSEWLADEYSIADIANWCWVRTHKWSGVEVDGLSGLQRWMNAMKEMPGMKKGIEVPVSLGNLLEDEKKQLEFKQRARETLQT